MTESTWNNLVTVKARVLGEIRVIRCIYDMLRAEGLTKVEYEDEEDTYPANEWKDLLDWLHETDESIVSFLNPNTGEGVTISFLYGNAPCEVVSDYVHVSPANAPGLSMVPGVTLQERIEHIITQSADWEEQGLIDWPPVSFASLTR